MPVGGTEFARGTEFVGAFFGTSHLCLPVGDTELLRGIEFVGGTEFVIALFQLQGVQVCLELLC
jgi:hypothetical protein